MNKAHQFPLVALCACFAAGVHAQNVTPGTTGYLQAARVNVRTQPQANGAVLDQPAINTPVQVMTRSGDWCKVELGGPNIDPKARQGFVSCNFVASQPLTLDAVRTQLAKQNQDAKARLDWRSRAFWLAPSFTRWNAVAVAMENVYLSAETRSKEIAQARPLRFKAPELEAMKQRLADGVLVTPETLETTLAPLSISGADGGFAYQHLRSAWQRIRMPAVKPSFFKRGELPVIVPSEKYGESDSTRAIALVDTLSAVNAAPFRAVVTAPASYALDDGGPTMALRDATAVLRVSGPLDVILGVWDVGSMRVTFDKAAYLHGVTVHGEPTMQQVEGMEINMGATETCTAAPIDMKMRSMKGYAKADAAIVRWAGRPLPGGISGRAQVKSRQFGGKGKYDLVVTHEVDLDGDGVPDFLVWQGRYEPQVSAEGIWTAVFSNIDGQWKLLAYDEDADCT